MVNVDLPIVLLKNLMVCAQIRFKGKVNHGSGIGDQTASFVPEKLNKVNDSVLIDRHWTDY